jgi:hypothetical protein
MALYRAFSRGLHIPRPQRIKSADRDRRRPFFLIASQQFHHHRPRPVARTPG